jgi:hypothetical protein
MELDLSCAEIREMLPAFVGNGEETLALRRHMARCEDCRMELRQYEELEGALGSLATATAEPPADLLPSLVAVPQRAAGPTTAVRDHMLRNRKAYAGGLAVALAGAAGAALWHSRSRRVATA